MNSAATHTKYTAIWRKLNINIAEELFNWGYIYDQLLEEVLFKLSHYARLTVYDTTSTNQVWKLYNTSFKVFSNAMRERYVRRFGPPRWASDEESVVKLIETFDTCCSRNMKSDIDEACWSGSEKQTQGSLEIAIRFHTGYALARRYMRQIKVDPSHIYATAGDDYQLQVGLWDPHQPYHALYPRTSFKLEPDLPWLHWDSALHSFVGKIPAEHGIRQARSDTTSNPSGHYRLEIRIIAITCDPLPMGVVRETIVRATVSIWVLLSEKIIPPFNILQTQGAYTFCPNSTEDSICDARAETTGSERLSQLNGSLTCKKIPDAGKQYKDFMLDSSFDTDLSGSEACFVSAMQSNFIPHLGSHTRMLRSTRVMTAAASNNQRLVSTDLANSSLIDDDHYDDNQSTTNSHEDMQYPNMLDSSHHGIQLPKSGVSNFLPPPSELETVHHGQGDHIRNSNSSMVNEIPDDISNCAIGIGNGSDHRNHNDERSHRYLNDSFGWDVSLMGPWEVAGECDGDDDNSEVWEFHNSFRMPEDAGSFSGHVNEDIQCGSSFRTTLQT